MTQPPTAKTDTRTQNVLTKSPIIIIPFCTYSRSFIAVSVCMYVVLYIDVLYKQSTGVGTVFGVRESSH